MLFGKRTTNIDNATTMHSLTPERERDGSPEKSLLREQTFQYDIKGFLCILLHLNSCYNKTEVVAAFKVVK